MNNCNSGCYGMGIQRSGNCEKPVHNTTAKSTDTSCGCTRAWFPVNTSLAMAYVPFQQSGEVYPCERALTRGTVFPCLDLPFLKGCCR